MVKKWPKSVYVNIECPLIIHKVLWAAVRYVGQERLQFSGIKKTVNSHYDLCAKPQNFWFYRKAPSGGETKVKQKN